ncbi:MAG: manganese efflux pump MntP family protein [Eubacteriales bacterium]|nr:manganese efflux pump MntP family protein [Eubacteriales bacterium]
MSLLNIIFIAFSLAMDAFAVSISNGLLLKKVRIKNGIKFGIFFGGFQFIMPIIGYYSGKIFEKQIIEFDHWIAFIFLTLIGGKMILDTFKEEENINDEKDILSIKNLTVLAIATSIDALAVGISFSILKVNIIISSIIIGIVAFILSFLGIIIGKKIGKRFSKNAEIIGGAILIFIGTKILIEHLFF